MGAFKFLTHARHVLSKQGKQYMCLGSFLGGGGGLLCVCLAVCVCRLFVRVCVPVCRYIYVTVSAGV